MPAKSDPMDLGRIEMRGNDSWEKVAEEDWDDDPGDDEDGNLCGFGEKC